MDELFSPIASENDAGDPRDRSLSMEIRKFASSRKWPTYSGTRNNRTALEIMIRRLGKVDISRERIRDVWDWYAANYDKMPHALPRISSAKQFDGRWDWIVREMERTCPAPIKLSPEAHKVLDYVGSSSWPEGVVQQLPGVISQSVENMLSFVRTMDRRNFDAPMDRYWRQIRLGLIPSPVEYLKFWFHNVHRIFMTVGSHERNIANWVWTPTHTLFVREANACLCRYTGRDGLWQTLIGG